MSAIEFKGELHTIPAGAALVLKVDRCITMEQAARIVEHCRRALGSEQRVLVIGPELTPVTSPADPQAQAMEQVARNLMRG